MIDCAKYCGKTCSDFLHSHDEYSDCRESLASCSCTSSAGASVGWIVGVIIFVVIISTIFCLICVCLSGEPDYYAGNRAYIAYPTAQPVVYANPGYVYSGGYSYNTGGYPTTRTIIYYGNSPTDQAQPDPYNANAATATATTTGQQQQRQPAQAQPTYAYNERKSSNEPKLAQAQTGVYEPQSNFVPAAPATASNNKRTDRRGRTSAEREQREQAAASAYAKHNIF